MLGSLSSQSTSAQTPSPSASPIPVQAVGVPRSCRLASYYIVDGGVVTIIAGVARLRSDVGVVVAAIHIGIATPSLSASPIPVRLGVPCAAAAGVDYIVDGGVVAIVAGIAGLR